MQRKNPVLIHPKLWSTDRTSFYGNKISGVKLSLPAHGELFTRTGPWPEGLLRRFKGDHRVAAVIPLPWRTKPQPGRTKGPGFPHHLCGGKVLHLPRRVQSLWGPQGENKGFPRRFPHSQPLAPQHGSNTWHKASLPGVHLACTGHPVVSHPWHPG